MKVHSYVFTAVINSLLLFHTFADDEVLKVYEDFFTKDDFDLIQRNSELTNGYQYAWFENIQLKASILSSHQAKRMVDTIGFEPTAPVKDKYVVLKELSAVGEKTLPHIDTTYNEDGEIVGFDSDVAIIFRNTNPNATFVFHHGNGEGDNSEFVQEVPVKKGSLLVFKGGTHYHQVDVKSGKVHLVGPFMLSTFNLVQGCRTLSEDLKHKEEGTGILQEVERERTLKTKSSKAPTTSKAPKAPATTKAPSSNKGKGKGSTPVPTVTPTASPTASPTSSPTSAPTSSPTVAPTASPTVSPTSAPTSSPTASPTASPTSSPTDAPTAAPTASPTASPTSSPTDAPTDAPTAAPTASPTPVPTARSRALAAWMEAGLHLDIED